MHPEKQPEVTEKQVFVDAMNDVMGMDIRQKCRKHELVWARNLVAYQLSKEGLTQEQISRLVGVNRTTVLWGVRNARWMFDHRSQYVPEHRLYREYQARLKELLK